VLSDELEPGEFSAPLRGMSRGRLGEISRSLGYLTLDVLGVVSVLLMSWVDFGWGWLGPWVWDVCWVGAGLIRGGQGLVLGVVTNWIGDIYGLVFT